MCNLLIESHAIISNLSFPYLILMSYIHPTPCYYSVTISNSVPCNYSVRDLFMEHYAFILHVWYVYSILCLKCAHVTNLYNIMLFILHVWLIYLILCFYSARVTYLFNTMLFILQVTIFDSITCNYSAFGIPLFNHMQLFCICNCLIQSYADSQVNVFFLSNAQHMARVLLAVRKLLLWVDC